MHRCYTGWDWPLTSKCYVWVQDAAVGSVVIIFTVICLMFSADINIVQLLKEELCQHDVSYFHSLLIWPTDYFKPSVCSVIYCNLTVYILKKKKKMSNYFFTGVCDPFPGPIQSVCSPESICLWAQFTITLSELCHLSRHQNRNYTDHRTKIHHSDASLGWRP